MAVSGQKITSQSGESPPRLLLHPASCVLAMKQSAPRVQHLLSDCKRGARNFLRLCEALSEKRSARRRLRQGVADIIIV